MKSFDVKYGTVAYDDEESRLFPTEQEAEEYFEEKRKEEEDSKD